jgi:hypothetical protein
MFDCVIINALGPIKLYYSVTSRNLIRLPLDTLGGQLIGILQVIVAMAIFRHNQAFQS